MFINFTNHPSNNWGQKQIEASLQFGEIVDLAFPQVDPKSSEEEIHALAQRYIEHIVEMEPEAILVAGEFSLCYHVVNGLLQKGVNVVCSCSERRTEEKTNADGSLTKTANFYFERYRKYQNF